MAGGSSSGNSNATAAVASSSSSHSSLKKISVKELKAAVQKLARKKHTFILTEQAATNWTNPTSCPFIKDLGEALGIEPDQVRKTLSRHRKKIKKFHRLFLNDVSKRARKLGKKLLFDEPPAKPAGGDLDDEDQEQDESEQQAYEEKQKEWKKAMVQRLSSISRGGENRKLFEQFTKVVIGAAGVVRQGKTKTMRKVVHKNMEAYVLLVLRMFITGKSFSRQDNSSDAPSYSESLLKYFKRLKARVKKDRADHPGADKEVFDGAEHAAGAGAGGPSYEDIFSDDEDEEGEESGDDEE